MKLSLFGRLAMALFASLALGLGMTACGGGTIGYMWVLGQQYNQIVGFKIDDYTGNLTSVEGSPFASNGSVPVSIVVKPGGRYIYVINQGTGGGPKLVNGVPTFVQGTGQTVALYSVGGDGTLTFQQNYFTQGFASQWAQFDSTGTYLYVLDKYSPSANASDCLTTPSASDCFGAITAFSSDSTTGRLTLLTNSQTQVGGVNTTYFNVGNQPFMMKTLSGCLFTVNGGNQTISPFAFGSSGQLTFTTTQTFPTTAGKITSINGAGSFIFLTDSANNMLDGYSVGSSCALVTLNGGNTPNITGTSNPTYTLIDSTSKYLYVLNQSTTSTIVGTPYSSISAFTINSTNQELQPIAGSPYTVGSGPVCIAEDPSNQYMFISNHNDGTVTGKVLDPTTGILSSLSRGSTFTATGQASCLAISGAVI
jgi:6-phosphogluconolactonase (cycloisomerase 2 family)